MRRSTTSFRNTWKNRIYLRGWQFFGRISHRFYRKLERDALKVEFEKLQKIIDYKDEGK